MSDIREWANFLLALILARYAFKVGQWVQIYRYEFNCFEESTLKIIYRLWKE